MNIVAAREAGFTMRPHSKTDFSLLLPVVQVMLQGRNILQLADQPVTY